MTPGSRLRKPPGSASACCEKTGAILPRFVSHPASKKGMFVALAFSQTASGAVCGMASRRKKTEALLSPSIQSGAHGRICVRVPSERYGNVFQSMFRSAICAALGVDSYGGTCRQREKRRKSRRNVPFHTKKTLIKFKQTMLSRN